MNRLRKRMLEMSTVEDAFQLEKNIEAILGMQRAGFAAGGVQVGAGTARTIREETQEAAVRARRHLAFSYVYERKTGGRAAPGPASYFSGLAQLGASASALSSALRTPTTDKVTKPYVGVGAV